MFNIGDYLKKFSIIGVDSALLDSVIKKAIKEKTGIGEEFITVSVKGATAYISTDRSTKNLIFLNKGDILEIISKHGLRKKITDIR